MEEIVSLSKELFLAFNKLLGLLKLIYSYVKVIANIERVIAVFILSGPLKLLKSVNVLFFRYFIGVECFRVPMVFVPTVYYPNK